MAVREHFSGFRGGKRSPILFVGQAPGHGGDGRPPFLGRVGRRLSSLARLPESDFRRRARFANVLSLWPGKSGKGDAFPAGLAREAAARFRFRDGERVVLAGMAVARAFRLNPRPLLTWRPFGPATVAVLPHPSGVNRWWNDPRNVAAAGRFVRRALRES